MALPNGTVNDIRDQDHLAAMDVVRYFGIGDSISRANVKPALNGPVLIITLEFVESKDLILRRAHFLRNNDDTRYTAEYCKFSMSSLISKLKVLKSYRLDCLYISFLNVVCIFYLP
uniref:Uncharacterized protein n=1 Tax=Panagrolaimus sp. ES5 TaxID=591445 RepID=A0AC34F3F9_9BILA